MGSVSDALPNCQVTAAIRRRDAALTPSNKPPNHNELRIRGIKRGWKQQQRYMTTERCPSTERNGAQLEKQRNYFAQLPHNKSDSL
jgi:hypothetical protein